MHDLSLMKFTLHTPQHVASCAECSRVLDQGCTCCGICQLADGTVQPVAFTCVADAIHFVATTTPVAFSIVGAENENTDELADALRDAIYPSLVAAEEIATAAILRARATLH